MSGAAWAGLRVGLLGGSFNPAHDGHRAISLDALRALRLDWVWWLVTPQNPLKGAIDMAPFARRLGRARQQARHPKILVTDLESRLGTRITATTLRALRRRFPRTRFVWLLGADNLAQLPRWRAWTEVFELTAIAVFRRPPWTLPALAGQAALRYRRRRVRDCAPAALARRTPPAWTLLRNRLSFTSATALRHASAAERPRRRPAPPRPEQVRQLVEQALDADQATDVVVIDLKGKSSIADYMVVASGRSARHVGAMAEKVRERLKQAGVAGIELEGLPQCDWVLLDAGDVIVHLFRPDVRAFYNLEKMWGIVRTAPGMPGAFDPGTGAQGDDEL